MPPRKRAAKKSTGRARTTQPQNAETTDVGQTLPQHRTTVNGRKATCRDCDWHLDAADSDQLAQDAADVHAGRRRRNRAE